MKPCNFHPFFSSLFCKSPKVPDVFNSLPLCLQQKSPYSSNSQSLLTTMITLSSSKLKFAQSFTQYLQNLKKFHVCLGRHLLIKISNLRFQGLFFINDFFVEKHFTKKYIKEIVIAVQRYVDFKRLT